MIRQLFYRIPVSLAIWILIVLNGLVICFHFLVLLGVIPYEIVWAGKLESVQDMYVFEGISLLINIVLMVVFNTKRISVLQNKPSPFINIILWFFVIVFAINTIGNLFSKTNIELFIATPLTFILSLLCLRLAIIK